MLNNQHLKETLLSSLQGGRGESGDEDVISLMTFQAREGIEVIC